MADDRQLRDLLQAICGEDARVAADALFRLGVRICPQGMAVSRETASALPALIDVVATEKSSIRVEVLRLLVQISGASHAWRKAAERTQSEFVENYLEKVEWEKEVDRIFGIAVPIFLRLGSDPEPDIASMAGDMADRYRGA